VVIYDRFLHFSDFILPLFHTRINVSDNTTPCSITVYYSIKNIKAFLYLGNNFSDVTNCTRNRKMYYFGIMIIVAVFF